MCRKFEFAAWWVLWTVTASAVQGCAMGEQVGSVREHTCVSPSAFGSQGLSEVAESYAFDGDFDQHFQDHPAWSSEEAKIVQVDGVARLSATGTWISEAWKRWYRSLPYDQSWLMRMTVTVPAEWESTKSAEDAPDAPQVGAGPWVGILDHEGKGRRVYEVNLAAIADEVRFVQGQLIENRLGEDPIHVGFVEGVPESVSLEVVFCAIDHTISLYCDGEHVDTQAIDDRGIDDWGMSADDTFYVGMMGFAEWTDLDQNAVVVDDFEVIVAAVSSSESAAPSASSSTDPR